MKISPEEWAVFDSAVPKRTDPTNRETEVSRPPFEGDTLMSYVSVSQLLRAEHGVSHLHMIIFG